jgi:penicillin amidase
MRLLKKIFFIFTSFVLVVTIVLAGSVAYSIRAPYPQTNGTAKLAGLSANVTVIRDKFGVPHIYADTPTDLFRAQGYVHAQDRFYQMEFWRRIGMGRLSELLGKASLEQDKFIRTIGWGRVATEEAAKLSGEIKDALEAYASGVNAYAGNRSAGELSVELRILGLIGRNWKFEAWEPKHTLAWAKVMAWDLRGDSMSNELLRTALTEKGGDALRNALLPAYPNDMPVIVGDATPNNAAYDLFAQNATHALTAMPELMEAIAQLDELVGSTQTRNEIGSNNWVISGARSVTGKPLLADDPHLGIQMPSIWYQVGLHCRTVSAACPYDVVGASFAGAPGVIIGHNQRIAWGVTNLGPDVQDLFIEKPNPANANEFEFMGKYEPAKIVEETINVAGDAPVTLKVQITRHGPIMNAVNDSLKNTPPTALRWTALEPTEVFRSILELNKAQNWQEFRNALKYWAAPSQNFVYADVDGNIGYQAPGNIPMRTKGTGFMPVPGWTGEYEWKGYIPFDELPSVFNPKEGFVATANNAVVDSKYPHHLSTDWDSGYRARRIVQMIRSKDKLSVGDIQAIHADAESGLAVDILPTLATVQLNFNSNTTAKNAWDEMMRWDRQYRSNSTGAIIFETFWLKLIHNVFDDELGADLAKRSIGTGAASRIALRTVMANQTAQWWDDVSTSNEKELASAIISKSFSQAVTQLKDKLGDNVLQWQWGKLHQATFKNQSLGQSGIAPIERLLNRGPIAANGASAAVNAVGHNESLSVVSVPSLRMIVDLADFNRSQFIHTTGQSGHPMHQHYDDMIQSWNDVQYNVLLWSRADIERNASSTLILEK